MTRAVEQVADPVPGPPSVRLRTARRRTDAWPLVLPALLPVAFSVYPLVQGLYLGLTDARAGRNVVTDRRDHHGGWAQVSGR
jgi:multiple sugar transport system permease protein